MNKTTILALSKVDRTLARIIKKAGPITLKPALKQSPYQALFESIVYQQLSGKAAATILGRVKKLFPKSSFPKPEEVLKTKDKIFRSAGLSGAKTAAIKDLAAKAIAGLVPSSKKIHRMEDTKIVELLTQIRGIGPWTVEMLLIFKLGRPDILPATDYGVRKGFALAYKKKDLPSPKALLEFGEKWRPYRTTAAWYMWRAIDLHRPPKQMPKQKKTPRK